MGKKRIHTHYDNLKVARDAPPEVIRAAYRVLSQRFHPDKNPGDERAARVMAIVNASYAVLSDASARAAHDAWILSQEGEAPTANAKQRFQGPSTDSTLSQSPEVLKRDIRERAWPLLLGTLVYGFYGVLFLVFVYAFFSESDPKLSNLPTYNANPSPAREAVPKEQLYRRAPLAPNGKPWPSHASYLIGYPKLHLNGLSTITVDNSSNDSDVFVKLVALEATSAFPVRQFFIPAHRKMLLTSVRAGRYDIRYQDLSSGHLLRSESFDLEEIQEPDGVRYSNVTLTLYKVPNGNFQTYPLSPSEF